MSFWEEKECKLLMLDNELGSECTYTKDFGCVFSLAVSEPRDIIYLFTTNISGGQSAENYSIANEPYANKSHAEGVFTF